jgi:4Fe-4S ferredoxin
VPTTTGKFLPVIDRNRCEGKVDCERVCPVSGFKVDTLPKELRTGLSCTGKLKGFAHRWQSALFINGEVSEAGGTWVKACSDHAITLAQV